MANPLSNLVNNLAEGIHKIKSNADIKYGHNDNKCDTCEDKYKN